jgi:hypothetical protein
MAELATSPSWLAVVAIVFVNVLLSGDKVVVSALADGSLSPRARRYGIFWGVASPWSGSGLRGESWRSDRRLERDSRLAAARGVHSPPMGGSNGLFINLRSDAGWSVPQ